MLKGCVDHSVRRGCSAAQAFQVLQITSLHLSARGFKPLCTRIRPRQSKHMVARADEFFHDGGTDESGRACNECAHMFPL
jgi:hypothetical protein